MPFVTPQSREEIEAAVEAYGPAPGGVALMRLEAAAADEAIATGVYVTWWSARARKECARVAGASRCMCGHALHEHRELDRRNPRAPPCAQCGCRAYDFVPQRPEECGMWWLPRRREFDIRTWRAPCRCKHGHDAHDARTGRCARCACRAFDGDYACITCDGRQTDHETLFELAEERAAAGKPTGEAFRPLAESSYLQERVIGPGGRGGGRGRGRGRGATAAGRAGGGGYAGAGGGGGRTPEQRLEAGEVSAQEYHRLIAAEAAGGPSQPSAAGERGGGALALARTVQPPPQPPTVRMCALDLGGGTTAAVLTNAGAPLPQPGRTDWTRPRPRGAPQPRKPAE